MCRLNGGLDDRLPVGALLPGELDDQNGVFGNETHQHDQANAGVNVVGLAPAPHEQQSAGWHAEDDRQGHEPALILRG